MLLSHPDSIAVITPTNLSFKLYETRDDLAASGSIIFELPYSVYNTDGQLLYRVSNHDGIFGNSILDRTLLLQSKPGQFYYLNFDSFQGKRSILLIVNAFTIASKKKISIGPTLKEQQPVDIISEALNTILFKLVEGERNTAQAGIPFYPIRSYFLQAPPSSSITRDLVRNHHLSEVIDYETDLDTSFILNPQVSGWFAVDQVTPAGTLPLVISQLTGSGVHRVLNYQDGLYYIGVSSEISLSQLYSALNVVGRTDIELGNQLINCKAELSLVGSVLDM